MKTINKNLRKLNKKGVGASKTEKQASAVFDGEIFKGGLPSLKFPSAQDMFVSGISKPKKLRTRKWSKPVS